MTSRLTIEIDFSNNNEPFIRCLIDNNSSDVRDRLLQHFFKKLGGDSSWLHVNFLDPQNDGTLIAKLAPVTPDELPTLVADAKARLKK